jgi:hypothetical protein
MKSTMLDAKPTHRHLPHHPQQNGNSAQIAAAAWLGFAKPKPHRTTSPDIYSIGIQNIHEIKIVTFNARYLRPSTQLIPPLNNYLIIHLLT